MTYHPLPDDIITASITDLVSDGSDSAYFHLDNGLILAVNAILVNGMPVLAVTRAVTHEVVERLSH